MGLIFFCPQCQSEINLFKEPYYHNEASCHFKCDICGFKTSSIDCKHLTKEEIAKQLEIPCYKTMRLSELLEKIRPEITIFTRKSFDNTRKLIIDIDGFFICVGTDTYYMLNQDDLQADDWYIIEEKEMNDLIIAKKLWKLLDDIDSASDMFKPNDLESYKKFYDCVMKKVSKRFNYLSSDGYKISKIKNEKQ